MKRWTLFVSTIPLPHNTWLTDGLSSFQGSRFFQANNGSTAKMPQVLIHGRGWKFCGAVRCEQRNHGRRTGGKCGCSAGTKSVTAGIAVLQQTVLNFILQGNKCEDELCIQLKEQRDFKWAEWIYLIYD